MSIFHFVGELLATILIQIKDLQVCAYRAIIGLIEKANSI